MSFSNLGSNLCAVFYNATLHCSCSPIASSSLCFLTHHQPNKSSLEFKPVLSFSGPTFFCTLWCALRFSKCICELKARARSNVTRIKLCGTYTTCSEAFGHSLGSTLLPINSPPPQSNLRPLSASILSVKTSSVLLDNLRRLPLLSSCTSGIHAQAIIASQNMKAEKTISIKRKLKVLRLSMLV
jgi:hypothetical protein